MPSNLKQNEILKILKEKLNNSYSPYSGFQVSSAVETDNGFYFGVNVENSSFPMTICAESSAITSMICSEGRTKIKQVVIVSSSENLCPPCGACLQRMLEFSTKDTKVLIANKDLTKKTTCMLEDMIKFKFNSSDFF